MAKNPKNEPISALRPSDSHRVHGVNLFRPVTYPAPYQKKITK